jgi:CRP-like cAMP-binding protein
VFILAQGQVEVFLTTDEDIVLDTLVVTGCVMGQYTMIEPGRRITYSARAATNVTLLEIEFNSLVDLLDENPELVTNI